MTMEHLTGMLVAVTTISVILTFVIAWANLRAVAAMKAQVTAATRPYVHFDIRLERTPYAPLHVAAVVINRGVTAAHNVEIKCLPELLKFPQRDLPHQKAILTQDQIPWLVPGREISEYLGPWETVKEKGQDQLFQITISYRDGYGTEFKEDCNISVGRLEEMGCLPRSDVAEELNAIALILQSYLNRH